MKARMRDRDVEVRPDIDRPGETVRLSTDHAGRIVCGHLIVESGVRADITASADQVDIKGEVVGHVYGNKVTVFQGASFVGRAKASLMQIAGRVNGFVLARRVVCRSGSSIEGGVVADDLQRQDGVSLMAFVAVDSMAVENADLVAKVEEKVFPPRSAPVLRIVPEAVDEGVADIPVDAVVESIPAPDISPAAEEPAPDPALAESADAEEPIPYLIR